MINIIHYYIIIIIMKMIISLLLNNSWAVGGTPTVTGPQYQST